MYINPLQCDVITFNISAHNWLGPYQQASQVKSVNSLGWKSNYFRMQILQGRVPISTDITGTFVQLSIPIRKVA